MKESELCVKIPDRASVEVFHACILTVLNERFGWRAAVFGFDALQHVTKKDKLRRLNRLAVRCADIEVFQRSLRTR